MPLNHSDQLEIVGYGSYTFTLFKM